MLILTRAAGESIVIGDGIHIKVLSIYTKGGKPFIKFGITAPRHIKVYREEIYEEIKRENTMAAATSPQGALELVEAWRAFGGPTGGNRAGAQPELPVR
ncbi:MAG TPA: carbon storage regulator CsrA [Firmicutes bacterium]|nr:carbon storage regulator CsrA [Bacillota bacterium]